jgi:hypothetical protein
MVQLLLHLVRYLKTLRSHAEAFWLEDGLDPMTQIEKIHLSMRTLVK